MSLFRLVKNKFFVAGFLVFLHLFLISYQIPLGSKQTLLERILFLIFAPVQRVAVGSYRLVVDSWENFLNLKKVQEENQELKKEIFFLTQEKQLLKVRLSLSLAQKELEETLKMLSDSVVAARIIGFDTSNYFRSAVIDRGSEDGITKNLPVCDKFGNLVGRTTEPIARHEAKVILITSEESGVAVISATDKMLGILSGDGQGKCLIKYVMASSTAGIEGDEIQTSGLDKIYPPGLKVGKIVSISAEQGIFKKIVVQPYFDFRELNLVAVLKNKELKN
ncbi:MAG: rod shape-determining protein MreC [Candidatus Aminicenantes bacterium]|nr:rod shape-determining protein MreC [Candidatus Aminicenantes bacterium]